MKIAQIVSLDADVPPRSQNGLEFVASWITEELVRRGHDVTLFATDQSKTRGHLVSLLPQEVWSLTAKAWQGSARSVWNTTLVASMADTFDIIHSHTGSIVFSMPFITKTPVIQTLHHPFTHDFWAPFFTEEPYHSQMAFIFDQYRKINYVTVSKKQEDDFAQVSAHAFEKHSCIHNGIPVEEFTHTNTLQDYLLYIGYINKDKGADVAVRVATTLGMKLILAGNNYGEEAFFEKSIAPHLNDRIQYVGVVDFKEKVKLYGGAMATLAPLGWDEPFGLTLVESQACSTPVIAFDRGAAREIVKDGETGFVVSTEEDMVAAVKKIQSIDRNACRAWVEKSFSVKTMVDQYEALYNTLLKK